MFGLGTSEIILILIVALIVFGPSRLPQIGGAVGKSIKEFKKSLNETNDDKNQDGEKKAEGKKEE